MTTLTQRVEFSCAYVMRYPSKLVDQPVSRFEPHQYRLEATVVRQGLDANKLVIGFDEFRDMLKQIVPAFSFIYQRQSEDEYLAEIFKSKGLSTSGYNFPISTENLVQEFAQELQHRLSYDHPGVSVTNAKLYETANSYAEWSAK